MPSTDIIYDHYKETCSIVREKIAERNRFFVFVCIAFLVLGLITVVPGVVTSFVEQWTEDAINVSLTISVHLLQTFTWLIALYLSIRYVQATIYIERQYFYIRKLEDDINVALKKQKAIERESSNYLNVYPFANNFIHFLYTVVFPLAVILAVVGKMSVDWILISAEWWQFPAVSALAIFDSVLALAILVLVAAYYYFIRQVAKFYEEQDVS